MEIKGFKEFEKQLEKMSKAADDLQGSNDVPLEELLTDTFLRKNTNFSSYNEFESGEIFSKHENLDQIPENELDDYVLNNTKFSSWREMLETASTEYVARKLGF
ncbi:hypothetical protein [Bacillus sp. 1735sda2]|uniref:hypothetical protein n=1 Tax=Bacillus sp. 1735sda2 TaxID=2953806 RepID=UPI0020A01F31|nr:hypothetical protein [Bacillus sp. 1735sda2]MCP1147357.1 hypothetical protein [Bacillus sp. 1735sda2]